MTYTAIRVNNISKRYRIGGNPAGYKTLRESINQSFRLPLAKAKQQDREAKILWALKDVSFEVKKGEVLGVIGRNGAGKSTLLKILSRITKPTNGEVRLRGRVGSLLEVGTGFHPELTGKENIQLNGSILGMKRVEIESKFEEIVAFAEIEKFLDTQVKFYSSGMYMRLAFSVAAHLQPEILLVDEVLAVGDASFQRKCLGKMGQVAEQGLTVLFVSHNMGAISQICHRGLLFENGRLQMDSDVSSVISSYLNGIRNVSSSSQFGYEPDKGVQITSMEIKAPDGINISACQHTEAVSIEITYVVEKWIIGSYVCMDVFNERDIRLLWSHDVDTIDDMVVDRQPGTYRAQVKIPGNILSPGHYYFTAAIYAPGKSMLVDVKEKAISLEVVDGGTLLSNFGIKSPAETIIPLTWKVEKLSYSLELPELDEKPQSTHKHESIF